jgi:hypothetical protein
VTDDDDDACSAVLGLARKQTLSTFSLQNHLKQGNTLLPLIFNFAL